MNDDAPPVPLTDEQVAASARVFGPERAAGLRVQARRERVVKTIREGQDAINIAFGAILSAYIGNVLATIDDKPFNHMNLVFFFVMIGVFIGGLCLGNSMLLNGFWSLGAMFLAAGAAAGMGALMAADSLGFEVAILKLLSICWVVTLLIGDGVLALIVTVHHGSVE